MEHDETGRAEGLMNIDESWLINGVETFFFFLFFLKE